ncbi:hypothetical protein SLS62_002852 [Diatrype stigma]|uniref:DUF7918 domain-containing protein n=1 Tax=Diatrype stigma TaxID=117547 RepID=A0AAN9UXD4_9PEZI
MAILDGAPGIKVTVKIGDATCIEYDDPEPDDMHASCPTVSKYIESIDDVEFGVCCEMGPDYAWGFKNHSLRFAVYIDGNYFDSFLLRWSAHGYDAYSIWSQHVRTETGGWVTRKPKFSTVTTVDDNTKIRLEKDKKSLKREYVIPRSPSTSEAIPEGLHDLSDAEIRRLAGEKLKDLQASHEQQFSYEVKTENGIIKREFGEAFDLTQDDSPTQPTKKAREVIDLTDS